jgi:hypothetical protein
VAYPEPAAGLVIRYAYLWRREYLDGQDEGVKDRPCAIILARQIVEGETQVVVLPITHEPPRNAQDAIEIPPETKRRLGLDSDKSWIVITEANNFIWPGPDLRPKQAGGDATDIAYGFLPQSLFRLVREKFLAYPGIQKNKTVRRD